MANLKCLLARMDDLLAQDPMLHPTAQTVIKDLVAPLTDGDCRFWLGQQGPRGKLQQIDIAANMSQPSSTNPFPAGEGETTYSFGLDINSLHVKQPMVIDSVCFVLRADLEGAALDGNLFGDMTHALAALLAGAGLPSTQTPWGNTAMANQASQPSLAAVSRYPSQLDINRCAMRAARLAMECFQVSVNCPGAVHGRHEILRERLMDVGNCAFGPIASGVGNNKRAWLNTVLRTNKRMQIMANNNLFPSQATANLFDFEVPAAQGATQNTDTNYGFFYPWNEVESVRATANTVQVVPWQQPVIDESLSTLTVPGARHWVKLPRPLVLDRDDNIDIKFDVDQEDEHYRNHMLQNMCYQPPISMIRGLDATRAAAQLLATSGAYTANMTQLFTRVPAGILRFGFLMKGYMVDCDECGSLKNFFRRCSDSDFSAMKCSKGRGTRISIADDAGLSMGDVVTATKSSGGVSGCGCG